MRYFNTSPYPMSYLGMTLVSSAVWENIYVRRFTKSLTNWKVSYIWNGGRLTLVNSTRLSLPAF